MYKTIPRPEEGEHGPYEGRQERALVQAWLRRLATLNKHITEQNWTSLLDGESLTAQLQELQAMQAEKRRRRLGAAPQQTEATQAMPGGTSRPTTASSERGAWRGDVA